MDSDLEPILSIAPLDEALADRHQRRGAHRRLFREMVKGELEAGPLSWMRRRALVKFAQRLEIDPFEARLLIRGVEYEGVTVPLTTMPSAQLEDPEFTRRGRWRAPTDDDVISERNKAAVIRTIILFLLVFLNYLLMRFMGVAPF
jgi:hypothetical protein